MLNSDGQCIRVITHRELGGGSSSWGFRPKAMEVRTIDSEDHLFVSGDFLEHPVGYILLDTLKYLKNKNIELIGYSNFLKKDNFSIKLTS